MPHEKLKDQRDEQPLANRSRLILDHESTKQGINPQEDLFQDQMNDEGQDIEDRLGAEERDPADLVEAFNRVR